MTPLYIVLHHVCPSIGLAISIVSFASPLPDILKADRTKQLLGLNPLPYPAMAASCVRGAIYGQITHDYYIYSGNVVGLLLSWYFIFTTYKLLTSKSQKQVTIVTLVAVAVLLIVGSVNLFQVVSSQILWGSTAVAFTTISYSAPLSSLFKVLRERDSSSIHWPLSLTNFINALLWFVYGMARKDYYFIALPNAMGVAFNTLSLMLCLVLPACERQKDSFSDDGGGSKPLTRSPSILQRLLRSFSGDSSSGSSSSIGSSSSSEPACMVDIDEPAACSDAKGALCKPHHHEHHYHEHHVKRSHPHAG